jgi:hypothetical protein
MSFAFLATVRRGPWVACTSDQNFDMAVRVIASGDKQALGSMIAQGRCTVLESGETVDVMDTHMFSGKVEVRKRGTASVLYTFYEAVQ